MALSLPQRSLHVAPILIVRLAISRQLLGKVQRPVGETRPMRPIMAAATLLPLIIDS